MNAPFSGAGQPFVLKCPQCGGGLTPGVEHYIVCPYCGSHVIWNRPAAAPPPDRPAAETAVPAGKTEPAAMRGIKVRRLSYCDDEVTHLPVFNMLIPSGWNFQGGLHWLLSNPGMPGTLAFQVANPNGAEALEVMPNMNFIWLTSGMMAAQGSHHFGAEVRKPIGIHDAFHKFILPRYRGQYGNLQLLKEEPLPDLPKMCKSEAVVSPIGLAEGGRVRIRYNWQRWQFDEEIYAVVEVFRAPIQTYFSSGEAITWFIDYIFSCRALAGRLDSMADLFGLMLRSLKVNPQWYAAFKSVAQTLIQRQIQHIHSIGQMGAIYAQTGREMREENLQQFYANQAIHDRLTTDWSRTIRDVDGFYDPHKGEVVELPSGYGHAWANNLGEYILAEDAGFNPNIGSTQHWEPMEQA